MIRDSLDPAAGISLNGPSANQVNGSQWREIRRTGAGVSTDFIAQEDDVETAREAVKDAVKSSCGSVRRRIYRIRRNNNR
jgi:hypothetical protein